MNEKILEKARIEAQNKYGEHESFQFKKAVAYGIIASMIAMILISFCEYIKFGKVNYDGLIIFSTLISATYGFSYKETRIKKELVYAIIVFLLDVILIAGFVLSLGA